MDFATVTKIAHQSVGPNPRHAAIRRAKRLLKLMPRRAVFHRYPVIGRFAPAARRRAYLWSFKARHVRPAIYLGAIVSLWPVMGLQLGVALAGAVLLRANIMVAGALQFVSNPLTAAPLYYLTYRVGKGLLFPTQPTPIDHLELHSSEEAVTTALESHGELEFGFTEVAAALFVGGTVCGLFFGVMLDLLYLRSIAGRTRIAEVSSSASDPAPSHSEPPR